MLDLVVEFEHPPEVCSHSNAMVRKAFEEAVAGGAIDALAKQLGLQIVFPGIAVPGRKTNMVLRVPTTPHREDSLSRAGSCRPMTCKFT
jgi:hypothetical protein